MTSNIVTHAAEQFLNATGEITFEVSGPSLDQSNLKASDLKKGPMYIVNENRRFPIHPEPNADYKICKLVHQYEVLVTTGETNVDNGLYLKTVLPVPGWILKSCISDGTLSEVTPETLERLVTIPEPKELTGWWGCLHSTAVVKAITIKVRKHPIYVVSGILLLHFFSECVIFADLITDIRVARTLSNAGENWLFMLSCVFILAPYYIAWAAAFGYLQKLAMESSTDSELKVIDDENEEKDEFYDYDSNREFKEDGDTSSSSEIVKRVSGSPDKKIQFFVILFAIAPIGVLILIFIDIYLLFEDFIIKPIYLCITKKRLREESHAERGYKKLRRVSEVVAETICQTVLQLYIYARFSRSNPDNVDLSAVLSSLVISFLVLILWTVVLKIESKQSGLHFYEYVTVVLQGSFNFVPLLPSIERGKRSAVNWTDFRFDSHSVGLVSKALISPECTLETIKLSAYSLKKLTTHECRFLGQMLADSPKGLVTVIFSRSHNEIKELFLAFDDNKSRTFDFREFLQLCAALRQNDDGVVSAKDVAEIFLDIADDTMHELYLTDLLWKVGKSVERLPVVDYDSPVMYALKSKQPKLLTFMIAAKVCDDVTWEYYTTSLVTKFRHEDALRMCEDRGVPIVIAVERAMDLPAHDFIDENDEGTSDPYTSVSVAGKVKRTETVMKNLNPVWAQPLLFLIPIEEIPDLIDIQSSSRLNAKTGSASPAYNIKRRHDDGYGGKSGVSRGMVGSTGGRLEINIKVYDFDETDDDFFMGSYKHLMKWSEHDLRQHQKQPNLLPELFSKTLKNREEEVGTFEFRIYTQTLLWYIHSKSRKKKHY